MASISRRSANRGNKSQSMLRHLRLEDSDTNKPISTVLTLIKVNKFTIDMLHELKFEMDCFVPFLLREVDEFRRQSFDTCGLNVNIVPAPHCKPVHNSFGTFIGFDKYTFTTYTEPPKSMLVRVHGKQMQLLYLGKWRAVSDFLRNVSLPIDDPRLSTSSGQYERQWTWWAMNGKKFRLLDLPAEVRETVYGFVFGQRIEPYPTSKARHGRVVRGPINAPQPAAALVRLNRQVHKEAAHMCFLRVPFFVEHLAIVRKLLLNADMRSNLRRLQLSLSHYELLRLLDGPLCKDALRSPAARTLRSMTLDSLEIEIAPPSLVTDSFNMDGACQRIVVGEILTAAFPIINLHPVHLTGFVKNRQKDIFNRACVAARKRYNVWMGFNVAAGLTKDKIKDYDDWLEDWGDDEDGGVILGECGMDWDESEVELLDTMDPNADPWETPRCNCAVPCDVETWTAED